jgi:hypothetical protein
MAANLITQVNSIAPRGIFRRDGGFLYICIYIRTVTLHNVPVSRQSLQSFPVARFRRSLSLSQAVDTHPITANFRHRLGNQTPPLNSSSRAVFRKSEAIGIAGNTVERIYWNSKNVELSIFMRVPTFFMWKLEPSQNSIEDQWMHSIIPSLFERVLSGICTETHSSFQFDLQSLGFTTGENPKAESIFYGILLKFIELRSEIQSESDFSLLFFDSDDLFYPVEEDENLVNWITNIDIQFRKRMSPIEFSDGSIDLIQLNPEDFNERALP